MRTVLTLLCLFALLAPAAAQNRIVNPDAETGDLSGWTFSAGTSAFDVHGVQVHAGSWSFWPGVDGTSGGRTLAIEQVVDVSDKANIIDANAAVVDFELWLYNARAGTATDRGMAWLTFYDGSGFNLNVEALATGSTNVWTHLTNTWNVPNGTREIVVMLQGVREVGESTDCFFDDLSLEIRADGVLAEGESWGGVKGLF